MGPDQQNNKALPTLPDAWDPYTRTGQDYKAMPPPPDEKMLFALNSRMTEQCSHWENKCLTPLIQNHGAMPPLPLRNYCRLQNRMTRQDQHCAAKWMLLPPFKMDSRRPLSTNSWTRNLFELLQISPVLLSRKITFTDCALTRAMIQFEVLCTWQSPTLAINLDSITMQIHIIQNDFKLVRHM